MPISAVSQTQVNGTSYSQLMNTPAKKMPEKHSSENLYKENKELFWAGAAAIGLATWAIVSHKNKIKTNNANLYKALTSKMESLDKYTVEGKMIQYLYEGKLPEGKNLFVVSLKNDSHKKGLKLPKDIDADVAIGYLNKDVMEDGKYNLADFQLLELAKLEKTDSFIQDVFDQNKTYVHPNNYTNVKDNIDEIFYKYVSGASGGGAPSSKFSSAPILEKFNSDKKAISPREIVSLEEEDISIELAKAIRDEKIPDNHNVFILDSKGEYAEPVEHAKEKIIIGSVNKDNYHDFNILNVFDADKLHGNVSDRLNADDGFSIFSMDSKLRKLILKDPVENRFALFNQ